MLDEMKISQLLSCWLIPTNERSAFSLCVWVCQKNSYFLYIHHIMR
jgi:hypothetical protein